MRKRSSLIYYALTISIFASIFASCNRSETINSSNDNSPKLITVHKNKFVDSRGRHVILNGINVISKSKEEGYLVPKDSTLYAQLRDWGFNSIRFGINWGTLEPEPGVYNEDYLKGIDKHIKWAADNNIAVVLDMHQDLYSVLYGNGAPEWATLHEGKPHVTGDVWSDAYMLSGAVQTALDNFWANSPAPDGIGLQDHYAQLWKHIAQRYANNPTVIGYDLMNEPFPGSSAQESMPALVVAYGKMIYDTTGKQLSEEELGYIWTNVDERTKALKSLTSKDNFAAVIDALHPYSKSFESEKVQPFYQKVSDAIREVDTRSILFLEHAYYGNMGVSSSIKRTQLSDGSPDPLVAYAPHGYDLVVDTKSAPDASHERLSFIYNRIKETGRELNMPVWLGEWGAFYSHGESIVPVAQHAISQIEENLFGNAYWSYESNLSALPYFQQAILRPYPVCTNGELLNYKYDRETKTFSMHWLEDKDSDAPTMIFAPNISKVDIDALDRSLSATIEKIPNSNAGWVIVPSKGDGNNRTLEVLITD